jgi:hypothetical protein
VNEDGLHRLIVFEGKMNFLKRVGEVEAAATEALRRLDPKLLRHPPRRASIPALRTLVEMAKPIWESLTGRKPSAYKVEKKDRESDVPDFIIFVQELAKISDCPIPSFKQAAVAFKPRPLPK